MRTGNCLKPVKHKRRGQYFPVRLLTERLTFTAASFGWMVVIFFLSSIEGPDSSGTLLSASNHWTDGTLSYFAHAVLYGILAILFQQTLWLWNLRHDFIWMVVATLCASVFGMTDEYHQSFVAGRSASLVDVMVDSLAALVAAVLFWLWSARFVRLRLRVF